MSASVAGVRVGHWSDPSALTGCTVIIPPPGTVGSVFVAGGAPATRETDLLRPGMLVQEVHAILLTGGSAFGLAAADGVMRWLEEHGRGFDSGVARVPIVPAAAIFDLWPGDATRRPGAAEGYSACETATQGPGSEGNVGAGMGATVGKMNGPAGASKGGLGRASAQVEEGWTVEALAVVNAWGQVLDVDNSVLAGSRLPPAKPPTGWQPPSTTLVCVVTDAGVTKEEAERLARMSATGLARSIHPVNTMFDGDAVFALSTRSLPARVDDVGRVAAELVSRAIRSAVLKAESVEGVPSCASPDGVPYDRH